MSPSNPEEITQTKQSKLWWLPVIALPIILALSYTHRGQSIIFTAIYQMGSAKQRRWSVRELSKFGPHGVSTLRLALSDEDANVRGEALLGVTRLGTHGRSALPEVMTFLAGEKLSFDQFHQASEFTKKLGELAIPALQEAFKDDKKRATALWLTVSLDGKAEALIDDILVLYQNGKESEKVQIAGVLTEVAVRTPAVKNALLRESQSDSREVQRSAKEALDALFPENK